MGRKEPATSNTAGASSWLVAHPAVVVNINMETKIIFSTSPLYQAPLQLATHALQPYALKQGGACEVFPPRVQVQHSKFDARLEALVAKYTGRVEGKWESRPPDACQNLILFQTTEFGKVRVILCTLATI